jgi:hypothetical protein
MWRGAARSVVVTVTLWAKEGEAAENTEAMAIADASTRFFMGITFVI